MAMLAAVSLALPCLSSVTLAQTAVEQKVDRRVRYAVTGALAGAVLAGGFHFASDRGRSAGNCRPASCALPFLSLSGAISGVFIARELDAAKRAATPRVGESDRYRLTGTKLAASPESFDIRDSLIAAVSDSGVVILSAAEQPRALRRRAAGLNGLNLIAFRLDEPSVLIGGTSALYSTGVETGTVTRLLGGSVSAIATSPTGWISASGRMVHVAAGLTRDSVELPSLVLSAHFDATGRRWWVGTENSLVEITMRDARAALGQQLDASAPVRAITSSDEWIAVAHGESGVSAWRRSTLREGVISTVRLQGEPRFAFDVAFAHGELFIAAGTDGLFRAALDPAARILGVSRQLPFVTLLRTDGLGRLWVGDRLRSELVRVDKP